MQTSQTETQIQPDDERAKKEAQTKNLMQTDRYHACFSTESIVIVLNGMGRHGIIHN